MRLIDADALYERLKADEELARNRVIDTPNSFPNGAVNPSAIRYMAQLSERTRFKEMVCDAPTVNAATPVVRCKDCKHNFSKKCHKDYNHEDIVCDYWDTDGLSDDDYCSRAGRSEE